MLTKTDLFSQQTTVRIDDINFGNHLCHSKFINLLHNARALFLKKYNLSETDCFGLALIMLNLNIDYLSQCFFADELNISIAFEKFTRVTVLFSYSVYNRTTNKLAAQAQTEMGFFCLRENKLKKIPVEFKKLVEEILV